MCGITGIFNIKEFSELLRNQALEMSRRLRHRGPDWSGIYSSSGAILTHERLTIIGSSSGSQPLFNQDRSIVLVANGEIYNYQELIESLGGYRFLTDSDSEVILALFEKKGIEFLNDLNGIFAFALYDNKNGSFLIARDHLGIIPLYWGKDKDGQLLIASELKALEGFCHEIEQFPPGHYIYSEQSYTPQRWYKKGWEAFEEVSENTTDLTTLQLALEKAVERQLMSDVPFGVLLSGGLDSSIIASITMNTIIKNGLSENRGFNKKLPVLHSFAVGLADSPDLIAARSAAEFIGTIHHEINFTIQEGLNAIRDVIYHLETYDVTTIRASTPMFLLGRAVKSYGIKMVLSGEGSDELFGGYLYFHKAPNAKEFHEETVRKLRKLYQYDCLRANKSLAAWGVEGRVPFLDKDFIDVAMTINPQDKMITPSRMEKWLLRKSFENILPENIAWRQKEQFSDGVGYRWIDTLKDQAEEMVSDAEFSNAAQRFSFNVPKTKEEYFYRTIFESHFPSEAASKTVPSVKSVACSTEEALKWDLSFEKLNDPSGRSIKNIHKDAYEEVEG